MRYTNYLFMTETLVKKTRKSNKWLKKRSNRDVMQYVLQSNSLTFGKTQQGFRCALGLALEFEFLRGPRNFIFLQDKELADHLQQSTFDDNKSNLNFPSNLFIMNFPREVKVNEMSVASCLFAIMTTNEIKRIFDDFYAYHKCEEFQPNFRFHDSEDMQIFIAGTGEGKNDLGVTLLSLNHFCKYLNGKLKIDCSCWEEGQEYATKTLSEYFRLIARVGTYLGVFPNSLIEGCPQNFRNAKNYKSGKKQIITSHPKVMHSDETDRKSHFRIGHYRHLASPYYKKMRGATIFVAATYVGGDALPKTATNVGKIPPSSWGMSLFCPPHSKAV